MRIIVQKFGGTSLKTPELRQRVVQHVQKALEEDYRVVIVVSAMGRRGDPYATDTLLDLINHNGKELNPRERDLLLSCGEIISASTLSSMLKMEHIDNCVLTGGQAGIVTNDTFSNAQIIAVNPKRLMEELARVPVAIVTGFQGQTPQGEVTTLGRGGSDTSATALAVALHAEMVDIFTDVEGIMTADPRIVEDAAPLDTVTYTEISNLAFQGAKVIHPRAVEIAMQTNIPIRVRSTLSDHAGTLVTHLNEINRTKNDVHDRLITGITQVPGVTQIKITAAEDDYDLHLKVFKAMAAHGISVDFISVNPSGIAYTVFDHVAERAQAILEEMGYRPQVLSNCAKVSTVGAGIAGVPGVMAKIVEALTQNEIPILQSADSHTTIWVLVHGHHMVRAVRALHHQFELHKLYIH